MKLLLNSQFLFFQFGLGPVPNKDVVLSYRDPTPLTGIAHVYLYGYAHYSIRWETVDVSLDAGISIHTFQQLHYHGDLKYLTLFLWGRSGLTDQ